MTDYNTITTQEFDDALSVILDKMSGEEILRIPGVYEVVSEEFNNAALDIALAESRSA